MPGDVLGARVLVLASLLWAGCGALGVSPAALGRALAMGGERNLRTPMRPIRGAPRVLLVALDGLSDPSLQRAIEEGRMPTLARVLGERVDARTWERGYAAPDVLSVIPSMTIPGWTAVYTGAAPAASGVVGNEWFDRREGRFFAPAPVSVSDRSQSLDTLTIGLLGRDLPVHTLYELAGVRSHVSMAPIHRGADLFTMPSPWDPAQLLGLLFEGALQDGYALEAFEEVDEQALDEAADGLSEQGIPDLQVLWFGGLDLVAHRADDPLEAQQRYLAEVVDPGLANILAIYDAHGALDDTILVVVADHGHSLVTPAGSILRRPAEVLEAAGFAVRPQVLDAPSAEHDTVIAHNGAFAYVYLADRSRCDPRCEWSAPPRFEEDVLPAAYALARGMTAQVDLVMVRPDHAEPFRVLDGARLVPLGDWLERHPRPDLPRFAERLAALTVGPRGHRTGDVLLMSRLSPRWAPEERTYFARPSRSFHGSASTLDSYVPLMVLGTRADGEVVRALVEMTLLADRSHARTTDLVLALLTAAPATSSGSVRAARSARRSGR